MAWLLRSMLQVCGFMSGCRAHAFGWVGLHGWLSCSRLRVWGFMAGCCAPCFQACGLHGLLLCSLLQVCGASWLAVVPVLQVSAEPRGLRPHIAAGHPGRGTHRLLSAAALALKWFPLRIFFYRLFLYLSII